MAKKLRNVGPSSISSPLVFMVVVRPNEVVYMDDSAAAAAIAGLTFVNGSGVTASRLLEVDVSTVHQYDVRGRTNVSAATPLERETIVTTYQATASGTGYSAGNTLTATRVLDVVGETATQVGPTVWFNETTGLALSAAPSSGHATVAGAVGLTDAQLRANPVPVTGGLTDAQMRATAVPVSGPVTDAQLRATAVPVSGPVTDAQLRATAVPVTNAGVGAIADAAAAADGSGNYSLVAAAKRALSNWTTLLARVPAQIIAGLFPVDTLAAVGLPRQLTASVSSQNTALTTTTRRVSLVARFADIRYMIGTGVQTANAGTSHFIQMGERLDWNVPANAQIAVIRDVNAAANGVLEVSELTT